MNTGYQITEQDELHYITFQIVKWIDIFTRQVYRDIVIDSLRFCMQNKGLEIYAFVVMSNHLHLLIKKSDISMKIRFERESLLLQKNTCIQVREIMSGYREF